MSICQKETLVHCGDFTDKGSLEHASRFADWFSSLSMYAEKLVISGNHDRNLKNPSAIDFMKLFPPHKDDNVTFLQDQLYVSPLYGLKIFSYA